MKPVPFELTRATSVAEAGAALSSGQAKCIAGGQSLGPMMNLRLARPDMLVDVTTLPGAAEIRAGDGYLEIGAAVTHARLEDGEAPGLLGAVLAEIAAGIAYRAVRTRGTIGGSLCHADPAADWVTTLTTLGATLVLTGPGGARNLTVPAFMQGAYRTALGPDEVLTAVRIPLLTPSACWGYYKICRKVGEFAEAMAAFVADPGGGVARVVFGATGGTPYHSAALSRALAETGRAAPAETVRDELARALPGLTDLRRHQLAVAYQRAVERGLSDD